MRSAASAAPTAAGTAAAVNRNARELMRRKSMTSCGPAMKPPQVASDLENVPMRRSTSVLDAEQLARPGAARAEHAGRVRLVDHQPRAVRLAELDDPRQGGDVALHREDAVDHDEHAAAVVCRALEHLLELVEAVVAERAQLGAREQAAVEDRGVVAGVGDHGVAGARGSCRACPTLAWWPVVKTIASSVPIHSAISRSSSRCRSIVPLSSREPVRPVP